MRPGVVSLLNQTLHGEIIRKKIFSLSVMFFSLFEQAL